MHGSAECKEYQQCPDCIVWSVIIGGLCVGLLLSPRMLQAWWMLVTKDLVMVMKDGLQNQVKNCNASDSTGAKSTYCLLTPTYVTTCT